MQKQSIKRLSILGLVLMAASAVTAAMMSRKTDNSHKKGFTIGSITFKGGMASSWSCSTTQNPDAVGCHPSTKAGSATTAEDLITSNDHNSGEGGAGHNNTTTGA